MSPDDDLSSDVNDLSYDISDGGDDYPSVSESANKEDDDSTCHSYSHDVPPAIYDSLFELEYLQDLHFLQQSTFQLKNDN